MGPSNKKYWKGRNVFFFTSRHTRTVIWGHRWHCQTDLKPVCSLIYLYSNRCFRTRWNQKFTVLLVFFFGSPTTFKTIQSIFIQQKSGGHDRTGCVVVTETERFSQKSKGKTTLNQRAGWLPQEHTKTGGGLGGISWPQWTVTRSVPSPLMRLLYQRGVLWWQDDAQKPFSPTALWD